MRGEARNPPTVSVLLAVYNGQDHVRQAIEGILTQSLQDFEFIIVDDGSTDRTSQISGRIRRSANRPTAPPREPRAHRRPEHGARGRTGRVRRKTGCRRLLLSRSVPGSGRFPSREAGHRPGRLEFGFRARRRRAPDPGRPNRILSASHGCFCSTVLSRTARSCSAARSSRISEAMGWATISSKISRSGRVSRDPIVSPTWNKPWLVCRRPAGSITARHSSEMGRAARRISLQNLQWIAGSSVSAAQRDALQHCLGNRPLTLAEALGLETGELRLGGRAPFPGILGQARSYPDGSGGGFADGLSPGWEAPFFARASGSGTNARGIPGERVSSDCGWLGRWRGMRSG